MNSPGTTTRSPTSCRFWHCRRALSWWTRSWRAISRAGRRPREARAMDDMDGMAGMDAVNLVDLAFVVDTTGSMGGLIGAAQRHMIRMVEEPARSPGRPRSGQLVADCRLSRDAK